MEEKTLEFRFKGNREYIQGPDIYNAIVNQFKNIRVTNISLSVHGLIKNGRCRMIDMSETEQSEGNVNYPVKCTLEADGMRHYIFLESLGANVGLKSIPYDESVIINQCIIKDEQIEHTGKSPFSFMETVVSMKKALLMNIYPDISGKWLFVKVEVDEAIDPRECLVVQLVRNLNFKIIKSNILHNDTCLGNLYFSLVT